MRTQEETRSRVSQLRAEGLSFREVGERLGCTAQYCRNVVNRYRRNQFFKDRKWSGENEPHWSHDASEEARWAWFKANRGILC